MLAFIRVALPILFFGGQGVHVAPAMSATTGGGYLSQRSDALGSLTELAQGVAGPALPLCNDWQNKYKYDQGSVCATMPKMKDFCQRVGVCSSREINYGAPHLYARGAGSYLILILPGTGVSPTLSDKRFPTIRSISQAAANTGSYMLSMSYAAMPVPVAIGNAFCRRPGATSDCLARQHQKVLFGGGVSSDTMWNVAKPYSVESQLERILGYLRWSSFLGGGKVKWGTVVAVGHSQGATHVAYLAHQRSLSKAVLLSGPLSDSGSVAVPWISNWGTSAATHNIAAMFAACEDDPRLIARNLIMMGLTKYQNFGVRAAKGPPAPIAPGSKNTNYLTAKRPTDSYCESFRLQSHALAMWPDPMLEDKRPEHDSVITDGQTPITSTGKVCYMNVWKQLISPGTRASAGPNSAQIKNLKDVLPPESPKCNL